VLKSPLSEIAVVAGLVLLAAASGIASLDWITRTAPWVMIGVIAALLGVLAWRDPQMLLDSMVALAASMAVVGLWGTFWIVVPPLVFGAMILGFPHERYIVTGLLAYPMIILILAYLRGSPYRDGSGDSGSRMLMHVIPLVLLVIVFAAGRAVEAITRHESDGWQSLGQHSEFTGDKVDTATEGSGERFDGAAA
jgi:hypothetical protein